MPIKECRNVLSIDTLLCSVIRAPRDIFVDCYHSRMYDLFSPAWILRKLLFDLLEHALVCCKCPDEADAVTISCTLTQYLLLYELCPHTEGGRQQGMSKSSVCETSCPLRNLNLFGFEGSLDSSSTAFDKPESCGIFGGKNKCI